MNLDKTTAGQAASNAFAALSGYQYIQFTTFRKTGAGVSALVWFAQDAGNVYVMTPSKAGKLKRLRSNGRVTLAPCKFNGHVLGPSVEGTARILSTDEQSLADKALARKYGLIYRLFGGAIYKLLGGKRIYIKIQPTHI